jgi:hypothetical protein
MDDQRAWRGREVSRVEGFSDAVFAFALTLLVVSLEVPRSFADLVATMEGFLAFAICFAFIVWVWYEHYLFFRRFGLQDGRTIVLNALLLFVVLFYVYPLKFLFTGLVRLWTGLGPEASAVAAFTDGRRVLAIYGIGFVAVFAGLTLLYRRAWSLSGALGFDALETWDARAGTIRHAATTVVGLVAIALALVLPDRLVGFAGMFYAVLGPVHGILGYRLGSRRVALAARVRAVDRAAGTPG